MKKFAHIVNLGIFPETSDLHAAQPVTVETMRVARDFASGSVDVTLLSAQYEEDQAAVPAYFTATPHLRQSVLDHEEFRIQRKLPLAKEILDRAYEAAACDYIIFTNVDIALLPNFYVTVDKLIDQGFDSFVINRRSISKEHIEVQDIPLMYAEAGKPHRGYDCYIFRRDAYPKFILGSICVGAAYIGKAILANQIMSSRRFEVFKGQHMTFHLGDDKAWRSKALKDYEEHNRREFNGIMQTLGAKDHPLIKKYIRDDRLRRIRNWLLDR